MKKILISLCLIAFKNTFCQSTFQVALSDSTANLRADKIIGFHDGSFIIQSNIYIDGVSEAEMTKLDRNGKQVWNKKYLEKGYRVSISCNAALENGDFLTAFRADSNGITSHGFVVAKCNSNGDIEWQKEIMHKNEEDFIGASAMCSSADGGFYLLYLLNVSYNYYGPYNYFMNKFDSKGNLLWSSKFQVQQDDYGMVARDITETGDRNVVAMINIVSCEAYCNYTRLYMFDKDGAAKATYSPPFSNFTGVYPIFTGDTKGQIHIMEYNSIDNRHGYYYYNIIQTESSKQKGYRMESNMYTLQKFVRQNNIDILKNKPFSGDKILTSDGGLLNIYTEYVVNKPTRIKVNKMDTLGRLCPAYKDTIPPYHIQSGESGIPHYIFTYRPVNKLFIRNATLTSSIQGNIEYICNGDAPAGIFTQSIEQVITKPFDNNIFIAPNPALNSFRLYLGNNGAGDIQMSITTSKGNILLTRKITMQASSNNIVIDVSTLPAGIYFVQLSGRNFGKALKLVKE